MITISKETALEILMQRLKYWTSEKKTLAQWEEYLTDWLDRVYEIELDPMYIIDNMWVNDLEFIDKEEIVDYNLEIGAQISIDGCCGTIDYIGGDFITILL